MAASRQPGGRDLQLGRWERLRWLLWRAGICLYEDGCLGIAKSAAYSGLLSFFPVLTAIALILVRFRAEQVADVISRFLFEVVPPGTEQLVLQHFAVYGEPPRSLLVVALLVSLWAASGLVLSLIEGFNAVYRIPTGRPLLTGRLVAVSLVFTSALPGLGASALILFGNRTEFWVVTALGMMERGEQLAGGIAVIGSLIRYAIALGAILLITVLLYKLGPNRPQSWLRLWPGALIAAVLWFTATLGFSWYVRNIADYNLLYGSIGAVIALLIWMYLLSLIALYGCAYNAESERLEAARSGKTGL
jgi:membrane protein